MAPSLPPGEEPNWLGSFFTYSFVLRFFLIVISIVSFQVVIKPLMLHVSMLIFSKENPECGLDIAKFVPIVGNLPEYKQQIQRDQNTIMDANVDQNDAKAKLLFFGSKPRLVLYDHKLIQQMMTKEFNNYGLTFVASLIFDKLIGRSLIASDGEQWKEQKKIISPAFNHKKLQSYIPIMSSSIDQWMLGLDERLGDSQVELEIGQHLRLMTLGVIGETSLGSAFTSNDETDNTVKSKFAEHVSEAIPDALLAASEYSRTFWHLMPYGRELPTSQRKALEKQSAICHKLVNRIISKQKSCEESSIGREDLLNFLMSAENKRISREDIRDQILLFIIAGTDTTSVLLSWTLYLLSQHPEVLEQCLDEISQVESTDVYSSVLKKFPGLHAVLLESLRMYPPIRILGRSSLKAHNLNKIPVAAGIDVVVPVARLHQDPQNWDEPLKFLPQRFRSGKNGEVRVPSPLYAFIPFGRGKRKCVGSDFALIEATIFLAKFLPKYKFKLTPGQKIVPSRGLTSPPKYGLYMTLSKRIMKV